MTKGSMRPQRKGKNRNPNQKQNQQQQQFRNAQMAPHERGGGEGSGGGGFVRGNTIAHPTPCTSTQNPMANRHHSGWSSRLNPASTVINKQRKHEPIARAMQQQGHHQARDVPPKQVSRSAVPIGAVAARVSSDLLRMQFMRKTMVRLDAEQKEAKKRGPTQGMERCETGEEGEKGMDAKRQRMAVKQELGEAGSSMVTGVAQRKMRIYATVEKLEDEPDHTLGTALIEERFTVLEELRFGRFSFNGQNPEVEKLMVYYECIRLGIEPPKEIEEDHSSKNGLEEGELSDSDEEGAKALDFEDMNPDDF